MKTCIFIALYILFSITGLTQSYRDIGFGEKPYRSLGRTSHFLPSSINNHFNKLVDTSFYRPQYAFADDSTRIFTFDYDSSGQLLSSVEVVYYKNAIDHINKYSFTYDAVGNQLTELYELFRQNKWNIIHRSTCTYDPHNNLLMRLWELYPDGSWMTVGKSIYTYDDSSRILLSLGLIWEAGEWKNTSRYSYLYQGNTQTELFEDWKNDSIWVNISRGLTTFNEDGKELSTFHERWRDSLWLNDYKKGYQYDDFNRLTEVLLEVWFDTIWYSYQRELYSYDVNGNIISVLWEKPDVTGWRNYWNDLYTYDANGNAVHASGYHSDGGPWVPTRGLLTVYYNMMNDYTEFECQWVEVEYQLFTIKKYVPDELTYKLVNNYPNPFNNYTVIKYSIPVQSRVNLSVYNILGQQVKQIRNEMQPGGSYEIKFNADDLPSGIYFYTLISESADGKQKFRSSQKMVLLK